MLSIFLFPKSNVSSLNSVILRQYSLKSEPLGVIKWTVEERMSSIFSGNLQAQTNTDKKYGLTWHPISILRPVITQQHKLKHFNYYMAWAAAGHSQ